jgi:hypothetical protein
MTVPQAERSAVPPVPLRPGPRPSPIADPLAVISQRRRQSTPTGFAVPVAVPCRTSGRAARRRWRQRSVWWSTSETLNNGADREHPPGTVKEEAADRFALTGG